MALCAAADRPVTALELELQAEVDKFVSCLLCENASPHRPGELRARLYDRVQFADDLDHEERDRYHTANGEARRYVEGLERRFLGPRREHRIGSMLEELRQFYRLSLQAKQGTSPERGLMPLRGGPLRPPRARGGVIRSSDVPVSLQ